jgi:ubiquinone/menaquinone biosynthesis C-methylase UbiE
MTEDRKGFFDRIADQWDGWADLERMAPALRAGLMELGVARSASVVDLGCGTGNLTAALMAHLEPEGRVFAVDFSQRMLDQARAKVTDGRVRWVHADALSLPLDEASADHVICFSAWPHFPQPLRVVEQVRRVLVPAGVFTVWHAISRSAVNAIHREVAPAVCSDVLIPASELTRLLETEGFAVDLSVDDDSRYVVRATLRKG